MVEEKHGFCTLCKSRCGAVFTVEDGRISGVRPDPDHPTGAAMCPKGRAAAEIAHSSRRLTTPLRRTRPKTDPDPGWEPISWDEAMTEISARLAAVAAQDGPEAVAFAVATPSGTMVSDATEWIERFVRRFGSPNTVYSAELCNWHKDFAHAFTFGCALPPPDYEGADLALLWGFNPAKTWLAQSAALSAAQAHGTRLAVVDPRRSTSALHADHWLRVRPGTDAALALGLAHLLIESGGYDEAFVRAWTNGPLLVRSDDGRFLRATDLDPTDRGAADPGRADPGAADPGAAVPGAADVGATDPGATGLPETDLSEAEPGDGDDATRFVVWDETTGRPEVYDTRAAAVAPEHFALRGVRQVRTRDGHTVPCVPAFERYAQACARWPLDRVAATTWIPEAEIRALAEELARARRVTYYGWTGVGQSANASQTERALATLYALTGSFDAVGGNRLAPPPPYRPATSFSDFAPEQRAKALGLGKHPLGPPSFGYVNAGDLCRAITEHQPYRVRALVGFGANLVVAQPDSDRVAAALRSLDFQVHLDLFPNPTSASADIVLPVNSAYEHEALRFGFEISHRAQEQVQLRPRIVEPLAGTRSDTEFVFDLACRLGLGGEFFDGDIEAAWDWQLAPLGLTAAELRGHPGGVRIPRAEGEHRYAAVQDGTVTGFATPTRRVELYSERLLEHGYPAVPEHRSTPGGDDPAFPLVLTCAKHGTYMHSQHRGVAGLRRRSADPQLDLHPDTAAARGIREGQWVELSTRLGSIRQRARFDADLHPGVVVAEYGWWEAAPDLGLPGGDPLGPRGGNMNRLVDHSVSDPLSGSVPLRSAACEVRPAADDASWSGTRPFTITALGSEGRGVRTVRLEPADGGPLPDHRPGQHVTVRTTPDADPAEARSYSLTGAAHEPGRRGYELAVRHLPDGVFSSWLHETARVGDTLQLTCPTGTFCLPTGIDHPVVLLAGGIGITPFLGLLNTLASEPDDAPEVLLHLGVADSGDHLFRERLRERLRELQRRLPRLRVVRHFSAPRPGDRPGRDFDVNGRITADDIDPELIARRARFYLCGPEAMIGDLTDGLVARGVPRFEIFSERFSPARRHVTIPDDARFTVRFARSGVERVWTPADGTLLELGERAGVPLRSGCRVGQCESCACALMEGEVTPLVTLSEELPDGETLTCQSVPASDVVLDA